MQRGLRRRIRARGGYDMMLTPMRGVQIPQRLHPPRANGFLFLTDISFPPSLCLSLTLFLFPSLGAPRYRSTSLRFAWMMDEHGRARGSRVYNQVSEHHSSSDGSSLQLAHYSDPKTNWSYRNAIQLDRLLHPPCRDRASIAARLLSRARQCARTRKSVCLCEDAYRRRSFVFIAPRRRACRKSRDLAWSGSSISAILLLSDLLLARLQHLRREMPVGSTRFTPRLYGLGALPGVPSARKMRRMREQIFNSRSCRILRLQESLFYVQGWLKKCKANGTRSVRDS